MSKLPKILAIDFDGTLCEDRYPEIGAPRQHVIDRVKRHVDNGGKTILHTCRNGQELEDAVKWSAQQGIFFDAVNENIKEVQELFCCDTRKPYADWYMDDKAVPV